MALLLQCNNVFEEYICCLRAHCDRAHDTPIAAPAGAAAAGAGGR
ncbi:hypothetical protein [Aquabacter spiritensis]|uniref:Uncharacterized protein n=1 Tax=Aquabacter spiritensis TaxID=933073 RepID=A0A4R3M218_9HYPH|nr:hypothetical protein [Aquabacter spiritensis]TCT06239.1 hypothetical protein EDC64_103343 [Aquabacter spiritensis]